MKRNIFGFILVLFGLVSCGSNGANNGDPDVTLIKIDNLEKSKTNFVSLQRISEEISFVNLVTPLNSPLSEVSKIVEFNDCFYIGDNKQKTIFVFKMNGQFVRKIGSYGKGPGEIIDLTDYFVDSRDSCVVISDIGKKEILKFQLDGRFITSVKTPFVGKCIIGLPSGDYALYSGFSSEYDLSVVNNDSKPIRDLFPVKDYMRYALISQTSQALSYNHNKEVMFLPGYSNNVYALSVGDVRVRYRFDFGGNQMPDNYIRKNYSGNPKDILNFYSFHLGKTDFAYYPFSFCDDREHLFFQFVFHDPNIYGSVFFKKSNACIVARGWSLDNDTQIKIRGGFKTLRNGVLTGYFYPYYLIESIGKLSIKEQNELFKEIPALKEFYFRKDITDNPSIIRCKLNSVL